MQTALSAGRPQHSDLARLVKWHNGEKSWLPFSNAEMSRRQSMLRAYMAENGLDACLLTSYHNICYFSGFLYCYFGCCHCRD